MRAADATHFGTISEYVKTGEVDDGMGGTHPTFGWEAVVSEVPLRYLPAGVGLRREEQGDRFRDSPSVILRAQDVGAIIGGEYQLEIDAGDDWRITIEGVTDVDEQQSIVNYRPIYGRGRLPEAIYLELQTLASDGGGS